MVLTSSAHATQQALLQLRLNGFLQLLMTAERRCDLRIMIECNSVSGSAHASYTTVLYMHHTQQSCTCTTHNTSTLGISQMSEALQRLTAAAINDMQSLQNFQKSVDEVPYMHGDEI